MNLAFLIKCSPHQQEKFVEVTIKFVSKSEKNCKKSQAQLRTENLRDDDTTANSKRSEMKYGSHSTQGLKLFSRDARKSGDREHLAF